MKFCSQCGSAVELVIPENDNRYRHVCTTCQTVHYQNPKVVTGCIVEHETKILMCKRAIEPRYGLWTLPAGFMENNETTSEGAARETMEEASADVDIIDLYAIYDIPHISQVYMMYRARLADPVQFGPGPESLEVELMDEGDIPWEQLAFPVIRETLIRYFDDRRRGQFTLQTGLITPEMRQLLGTRPPGY